MTANKAFIVVAITAVLGVLATSSATASDHRGRGRGWVVPCSLEGVNPVYHRDIFGDPAVARSYGFVRGADGSWHVAPGCRR